MADVKYLSKFCNTGSLELFQSVNNKYCPKMLHFTLEGIIVKTLLAALDYNCGSNNTQATTNDGERRCKQVFSKVMQNWTKDREYINELLPSTLEVSPESRWNYL